MRGNKGGKGKGMFPRQHQSPKVTELGVDGRMERDHSVHEGQVLPGAHHRHVIAPEQ